MNATEIPKSCFCPTLLNVLGFLSSYFKVNVGESYTHTDFACYL